jgi:VanZ family protein
MTECAKQSNKAPSRGFVAISWLAVAVWAVVIFFMSSRTGGQLNSEMGFVSWIIEQIKSFCVSIASGNTELTFQIGHFCEYGIFGALLCNAFRLHMPLRKALVCAILCASLYGVSDEIHQYFVPSRSCDPVDWMIDTIGATCGAGIFLLLARLLNGRMAKKHATGV